MAQRQVGRPKGFDDDVVLALAAECFRERGFEATSVRDMSDWMGISRASLYNSFGDKRAHYRKVLDHHVAHGFADRAERFERHNPPRAAIAAFPTDLEPGHRDPKRFAIR